MKQSKELTQFYKEIYAWAMAGCPEHDVFETTWGLCSNAEFYGIAVKHEMIEQFVEAGLYGGFPFGIEDYYDRSHDGTLYKCPKRLAWLAHHCDVQHIKEEE